MRITQEYVNNLSYKIVGCAIEVHRHLGPGLLESVYQPCFVDELKEKGFKVETQVRIPIAYKGKDLGSYLIIDVLVEDLIIVELKAVELMNPVYEAQLLSYLKLTGKPKGLLINFNAVTIKQDLKPYVTEVFSSLPIK